MKFKLVNQGKKNLMMFLMTCLMRIVLKSRCKNKMMKKNLIMN